MGAVHKIAFLIAFAYCGSLTNLVFASEVEDCTEQSAMIDSLIEQAEGRTDLWKNASCGVARHEPSGFDCYYDPAKDRNLVRIGVDKLRPSSKDSAYCEYTTFNGGNAKVWVNRSVPGKPQTELLEQINQDLLAEYSDPEEISVLGMTVWGKQIGAMGDVKVRAPKLKPATSGYMIKDEGPQFYIMNWVGTVEGWDVTAQVFSSENDMRSQLSYALYWSLGVSSIQESAEIVTPESGIEICGKKFESSLEATETIQPSEEFRVFVKNPDFVAIREQGTPHKWLLTKETHEAHPTVMCVKPVPGSLGRSTITEVRCGAGKEVCEKWTADFGKLGELLAKTNR